MHLKHSPREIEQYQISNDHCKDLASRLYLTLFQSRGRRIDDFVRLALASTLDVHTANALGRRMMLCEQINSKRPMEGGEREGRSSSDGRTIRWTACPATYTNFRFLACARAKKAKYRSGKNRGFLPHKATTALSCCSARLQPNASRHW